MINPNYIIPGSLLVPSSGTSPATQSPYSTPQSVFGNPSAGMSSLLPDSVYNDPVVSLMQGSLSDCENPSYGVGMPAQGASGMSGLLPDSATNDPIVSSMGGTLSNCENPNYGVSMPTQGAASPYAASPYTASPYTASPYAGYPQSQGAMLM